MDIYICHMFFLYNLPPCRMIILMMMKMIITKLMTVVKVGTFTSTFLCYFWLILWSCHLYEINGLINLWSTRAILMVSKHCRWRYLLITMWRMWTVWCKLRRYGSTPFSYRISWDFKCEFDTIQGFLQIQRSYLLMVAFLWVWLLKFCGWNFLLDEKDM